MKISSKERKKLKGHAHSIKPLIIIGKEGVSENTINTINDMIENKELIKIKFNSYKDQKNLLIKKIESSCNVNIIDQIGNIVILFKQNIDIEKRNFIK